MTTSVLGACVVGVMLYILKSLAQDLSSVEIVEVLATEATRGA